MIVVSDASPINHLCRIGRIEVVASLFGQLVVPANVMIELSRESTPLVVRQFAESPPEWINVQAASDSHDSLAKLGAGEREAISLAMELGAELVIIDDKAARRAALHHGLNVIGTLGVVNLAQQRGLLDFQSAIEQLRGSGFYMSDELVRTLHRPSP